MLVDELREMVKLNNPLYKDLKKHATDAAFEGRSQVTVMYDLTKEDYIVLDLFLKDLDKVTTHFESDGLLAYYTFYVGESVVDNIYTSERVEVTLSWELESSSSSYNLI